MENELQTAIEVVKATQILLKANFGKGIYNQKTSAQDIVTQTDLDVENIVKAALKEKFPKYGFLGEETTEKNEKKDFWVLDPIDGTTNYAVGLPEFAVSLALIKDQKTVLGIIFDPIHDELFHATLGGGAFCNNKPIVVSKTPTLAKSVIHFNSGYNHRSECGQIVAKIGDAIRQPCMGRSTAIQLTDIACGRSDAVVKNHSSLIDTLAGFLLITEAGGKVTDFLGKPLTLTKISQNAKNWNVHYLATNRRIHDELVLALK
ncbi:MAG: inositol monophosphatase [Candidatus Diapherotrites archaeon]|uniref:inositol-phosphate phosphatase n=1 Tax=Candidatus Iainarchaeum sp. TaxID=3101447 RepID=A0A8T4L5U5_9ARCH|nr:inositol monophosphatase [Candidatus Diapherotrites archaeon]